jgi:hypothetical protein
VLKAVIPDAIIIDEDAQIRGIVENDTIKPKNYGEYMPIHSLKKMSYKIEKAQLRSTKLKGSIKDIIQNVASDGTDAPLSIIDESIFWLEESLSLSADPQTCLHLALALEVKLGLTKDSKTKEAITRQIAARCKLARQLDIEEDYKEEIEAISKKYEEKKDKKEEPDKNVKPTSSISLSIEGSAKGEISSKEAKEKDAAKK